MDIQATQILEDEESLPYQTFNEKDELTQPIGALIINGRTHPIKVGINKIGRHPACDIVIDEQDSKWGR
ncbi:hypothetical protein KM043_015770 [Ampulex compressa]|nr:hypothetical protein KM043_015770 [Ampulex compressa]